MHPIRIGIPIVIIALFILYVLYLLIIKKDKNAIKKVVFPGLFFIGIWAILYFLFLK